MRGPCPSCGRAFTADADETRPGTPAETLTDIGGLDDVTGAGLEEVTGFGSEAATDAYGAGATFAPTAEGRGHGGNGGHAHAADDQHGPLMPGQNFGDRYHIVRLLGLGGMGAVYQAWDTELGVVVAVKVIRPEASADPAAAQALERRFKQELLLARQVTHPNVVRIHDLGEMQGIKYITMPYIQGEDLSTLLKREGKLPVQRTLKIARSMISGLAAAHAAGVVHRDLKPANIMVTEEDDAMIMDFGIARSMTSGAPAAAGQSATAAGAGAAGQTMLGSVVGTIEYMAPEQARALPVDQRADLYAFGLILYDLLLGRTRAAGTNNAFDELNLRMRETPPPARTKDASIPEALDRIITKCIQPDPEARYATTTELVAEIDKLDENGKPLPMVRRLTWRIGATAVSVVAGLLVLTWWLSRGPALVVERPPMSVLIADFDNQTGETVFDGAVEQTLGLAMEAASFIDLYPRSSAQQRVAQLKPGSRLDEQMARVLSHRETIDVILVGSIARDGAGYTISVRAIDPRQEGEHTRPLASATASAANRDKVLPTLGVLAARIRGPLGDATPESARLAAADTFTTSSPEAVQTYTRAQDLLFAGRTAEALDAYLRAIEQDPNFGRAYSGAAIAARRLGREAEVQEYWKKALSLMDRMTEREKYRTLGAYYLQVARNYEKAIENFSALVDAYPADRAGHASLALAHFWALDIPKALEEEKRALELDPKSVLLRINYALYAMYAGEFETAATETKRVIEQEPTLDLAYVPLAISALARADVAGAREAYAKMAGVGTSGASRAAAGLADIALYEGRYTDVEAILKPALIDDEKAGDLAGMASKWIALAEAYEGLGKPAAAVAAARKALKLAESSPLQVLAAAVLIRAGQDRDAKAIASAFSQRLEPQSRAYGKILEGRIALRERRTADAVDAFTAAQKHADLWLARFDLGVAYVQAGYYAEGFNELDRCQKRRGEATAVLLDEVPTFRYLATLPYWLGRAQEGVQQHAAAKENYKSFLAIRSGSPNDPMVIDARKRLSSQ